VNDLSALSTSNYRIYKLSPLSGDNLSPFHLAGG